MWVMRPNQPLHMGATGCFNTVFCRNLSRKIFSGLVWKIELPILDDSNHYMWGLQVVKIHR